MIYKKIYLNQYKLYAKQKIDKLYSPKSENNLAIIYQKKKKNPLTSKADLKIILVIKIS